LVDDEPANISLLERFINRCCHATVSRANSAEEAILAVESGQIFDLIVCDYQMPGGGGTKVYELVCAQKKVHPYFLLWTQTDPAEIPDIQGPGYLGSVEKSNVRRVCSVVTDLDSHMHQINDSIIWRKLGTGESHAGLIG
jgi:CheY-like chemotaxis protein